MSKTEFEIGVKHGELVGEVVIGLLCLSGGGSIIIGVMKTCNAVNVVAKTYKRINSSPEQLLEDSIIAVSNAF